jgi:hypothetical protein
MNYLKTTVLLAALTALLIGFGNLIGGQGRADNFGHSSYLIAVHRQSVPRWIVRPVQHSSADGETHREA